MSVLRRAGFSHLLRHPWQLSLALVGIVAGVAVMVAVDIATDSARRAFQASMDAVYGEATHHIVAGPRGVDEQLYVRLRTQDGLRNIAPVVEGYVDTEQATLDVLGVDPFAERGFRAWTQTGDDRPRDGASTAGSRELARRLLTEPGAVLVSGRTAAALGADVGDSFAILAGGRTFAATLAGLLPADDARLDDILVADIATAQAWLDMQGRLSRIDLRAEPPAASPANDGTAETLQRVERLLPEGVRVLPAAARSRAVGEMTDAFMTNLTAMSLLALLVGVFLIYNSVSFAVLQRRALLGVLRALGLTRGETFRMVLVEAGALGVAGAVLGVAAGTWLGAHLLELVTRSINDLYFVVNVTNVTLTMPALGRGMAAGIAATLAAASVPALEAATAPPRLALARSSVEGRSRALLPAVTATGAAMIAVAALLLVLRQSSLVAGLASLFLLLLGFALLLPLLLRTLSALTAPLAAAIGGVPARQAVAGVGASLSRTGVAVAALAVAVSATVGVTLMVDSFRSAVGAWVERSLQADLYVGVGRGSLDPALASELAAVDGVAAHSSARRVWLETGAYPTRLTVLDLPPQARRGTELLEGDPASVWPAFEKDGAVLVSASYAWRHDVKPGDALALPTSHGERAFPVAAIYRSYATELDTILMSRQVYEVFWEDPAVDSLGLYLETGAAADRVVRRLREASAGRQALVIRSNRELRDATLRIFDRTFVITDVLYWLTLGVAAVGILGAMLAMQLERAREYAILRALGLTPGQLAALIGGQAAFIGLVSGLAALPLGLLLAGVLIEVINRRAFGWQMEMSVSARPLVAALVLSAGAALLAAVLPAWRAARSLPASAMREE